MLLRAARIAPRPDGLPLLLVALNLMMLSFFILLNSMSSPPTDDSERHAITVLGRVKEGYDMRQPEVDDKGTIPQVPTASWADDTAKKLHGVVVNRLQLTSVPLTADANRVVLTLPANTLFAGDAFIGAETVRALMLAAQGSRLQWRISGEATSLPAQGAGLAGITGQIAMQRGQPEVRLVVTPGSSAPPAVGAGVGGIVQPLGGAVEGQAQ